MAQDALHEVMDQIAKYVLRGQSAPEELWGQFVQQRDELERLRDAAGFRRD